MPAEENTQSADQDDVSDDHAKAQSTAEGPESTGQSTHKVDDLEFGDAKMPEGSPVDEPELEGLDLQAALDQANARADENWERVLRMQADIENQRKRALKDVENARKFSLEGIINDLLPVRDSLEMGLAAAREQDAEPTKIIEGSDLTLKMLSQAFEKYNINEINPLDQKFDPEYHQAMSMQEVQGVEPNTVTGVLQKGYTLNDRLIRPALVMVAK